MDDKQRIALVRVGPAHPDDRGPAVQFHLGDHLGSSNVVVDDAGALTSTARSSRPTGRRASGASPSKRYRFTGKERDEESGLCYHDARYYAPWLGRWVSCDPAGPAGGLNVYAYGFNSPLCFVDGTGMEPEKFVYDADGTKIPTEVIEVKGTDPFLGRYPDLHSAVNRGLSHVSSWQQYKRTIMSDLGDLRSYSAWIKGAGVLWEGVEPDQAHAEYERELNAKVDREYDRYLAGEAAKLASNYRRIDAAANVVDHIAVVTIAAPVIVAGGEILTPLVTAARRARRRTRSGRRSTTRLRSSLPGPLPTEWWLLRAHPTSLARATTSAGRCEGPGSRSSTGHTAPGAPVQLGIQHLKAEVYAGDKLVETIMVNVSDLRSMKPAIDLTGKGLYRWTRALEEVASGVSGPIKINTQPGGVPIHSVRILKPR